MVQLISLPESNCVCMLLGLLVHKFDRPDTPTKVSWQWHGSVVIGGKVATESLGEFIGE